MANEVDRNNPYGEVERVEALAPTALEATVRAEVDVQVATAKRHPREIQRSLERARRMALSTPEVAEMCFYSLPRGGKVVEGATVRFAEILASTWGNLRVAARVMDIGEKQVVCCAVCHDLESNTAIASEVIRRITDKHGARFSDDMVAVTCNAASSIALRNSVLHCIPRPLWEPIYEACRAEAGGEKRPIQERRERVIAWFKSQGISEAQVLRKLEKAKVGDLDTNDLLTLAGIRNAIREGQATPEEAFDLPAGVAKTRDLRPQGTAPAAPPRGAEPGKAPEVQPAAEVPPAAKPAPAPATPAASNVAPSDPREAVTGEIKELEAEHKRITGRELGINWTDVDALEQQDLQDLLRDLQEHMKSVRPAPDAKRRPGRPRKPEAAAESA